MVDLFHMFAAMRIAQPTKKEFANTSKKKIPSIRFSLYCWAINMLCGSEPSSLPDTPFHRVPQVPFCPPKPKVQEPSPVGSTLQEDLHCLLSCAAFTDLVLVAGGSTTSGGTVVHTHRWVLSPPKVALPVCARHYQVPAAEKLLWLQH